jgi:tetratricopeptide (TPR) repeat protein
MTMDGRWKLAFAGGVLLTGLVGCTTTNEPPGLPTPEQFPVGKNSVVIPEPTDEGEMKDGPLACSTLVLFANMWVDDVAKNPNKPAAEREQSLNKALRVYQDVLAREPQNVDALFGLGQLYHVTGEVDKLREIEKKAMSLHSQNPKVWAWVAVRQAQAKQWDRAVESYSQAVKLDSENRKYRIHLAFTLARSGRYAEGYDWLSRSMGEAEAHYNLAQMMIHNGDIEKARVELRLALEADPGFKVAAEQLMTLANSGSNANLPEVPMKNRMELPAPAPALPSPAPIQPSVPRPTGSIPPIRIGGQ